jgi:hypothetical protein
VGFVKTGVLGFCFATHERHPLRGPDEFDLGEVFGLTPRIQRAVSELADDWNRKQEFSWRLRQESAGLACE